jgi:hypothetical protein
LIFEKAAIMTEPDNNTENNVPKGLRGAHAIRALLNIAGGAIPFVGGVLSAGSGAWSEREQETHFEDGGYRVGENGSKVLIIGEAFSRIRI